MDKILFSVGLILLTVVLWILMFALLVSNPITYECLAMLLTSILATLVTTWTIQHVRSL